MSKDEYIQWLELAIVNELVNDKLCERLHDKCTLWCREKCRWHKFNTRCLRQLAEVEIWER